MKRMRRVGALDGTGRGCVITEPAPEVAQGEILVEVHASLISPGTELSGARRARSNPDAQPGTPRPFGYQNAGVVVEVGPGVEQFSPGDRVACMGSGYALHTDYAVVPQNLCAHLPAGVSFEQGAYTHLAITSLHAVRRGRPEIGETCVVVGLGLVGQMAARFAQSGGMHVMGWDRIRFRCEKALEWGIDDVTVVGEDDLEAKARAFTNGRGFDMAIVAFGGEGTEVLKSLCKVMKVSPDTHLMGRICLVGGVTMQCAWGAGLGNMDLRSCARTGPGYHDERWERGLVEYPPVFMRWTTRTNMELALRYMDEGRLDVDVLTTHRLPLERIDEAVSAHIEHPDQTLGTILLP